MQTERELKKLCVCYIDGSYIYIGVFGKQRVWTNAM